jgi:hypothetical protein
MLRMPRSISTISKGHNRRGRYISIGCYDLLYRSINGAGSYCLRWVWLLLSAASDFDSPWISGDLGFGFAFFAGLFVCVVEVVRCSVVSKLLFSCFLLLRRSYIL